MLQRESLFGERQLQAACFFLGSFALWPELSDGFADFGELQGQGAIVLPSRLELFVECQQLVASSVQSILEGDDRGFDLRATPVSIGEAFFACRDFLPGFFLDSQAAGQIRVRMIPFLSQRSVAD